MSLSRVLATLLTIAAAAWAAPASPQDAIAFVFVQSHDVRLASVSAIPRLPRKATADTNTWKLSAIAPTGEILWQRAFRAPRAFHAGSASNAAFTVTGPRPPAGAQVVLADEQGTVLWQILVDEAFLAVADDNAATAMKQVAGPVSMTKTVMSRPASAALSRQITSIRAKGGAATRDTDAAHSTATPPPARLAPPVPLLNRSQSGAISKDGEIPVTIRFVDDEGNPPGVAFSGHFYAPSMGFSSFDVPASGTVTLTLAPGGTYQMFISPPMPFVASDFWFTYDGKAPAFTLERGWILDVDVRNAATGTALSWLGGARIYSTYMQNYHPTTIVDSHAKAAVPKDPDLALGINIFGTPGFATHVYHPLGTVSGSVTLTASIEPAKDIPVRVRDTSGSTPHDGSLRCESISALNDVWFESEAQLTRGSATLPIATSTAYTCSVALDDGYTTTFRNLRFNGQATAWDIPLTRTTRINIVDASGNPIDIGLYGHWVDDMHRDRAYCNENPCLIKTPTDRAVSIAIEFEDPAYADVQLPPAIYSSDPPAPIVAIRQYIISGHVEQNFGGYTFDRIRALDSSGNFVTSTTANSSGDFEIPLPSGDYILELERNEEDMYAGRLFYEKPTRVGPIHVASDSNIGSISHDDSRGTWHLDTRTPCSVPGEPAYASNAGVAVNLVADDGTRLFKTALGGDPLGSSGDGLCATRYSIALSPGTYRVQAAPAGWLPRDFSAITIQAGSTAQSQGTFPASARTFVWKPVFANEDGSDADGLNIQLLNHNQTQVGWFVVAAGAQAIIPYQPGWFAEIRPDANGYGMRQRVQFSDDPPPSDVVLSDLSFDGGTPDSGMVRILGDGDRSRNVDILFLADGYTADRESFTDLNGNGVWDGIVWFDLNHDGILEHQVDQFGVYGDVDYPRDGVAPDAESEPFDDINGDGVPNFDDPALFRLNAEAFLRSLLGSDVFETHREGFNAYVLFEPSRESGVSQQGGGRAMPWERDTAYHSQANPSGILFADSTKLQSRASLLLPEVDIVVLLVNDVMSMSKRSGVTMAGDFSVITMWSGRYVTDALSATPAHEMGHALAGLCDEYAEYIGPTPHRPGAASHCSNAAFSPRIEDVPWMGMIFDGTSIPTRHLDGSIGVYEGASGFTGGRYRPTYHSMMRYVSPLFNAPSRAALGRAMAEADDDASVPRIRPGAPAHSRIRKPHPL